MFKSARIKLTLLYLALIMAVSVGFSGFIYRGVNMEFQRRFEAIELRLDQEEFLPGPPRFQQQMFLEDLEQARHRVLLILIYANIVILVYAGGAGYFLAGRTLRPIEQAMEEQKRFIADASHELKTPLTALKTSIEVTLRDKKLNLKSARQALKENLEEADSLTNLANDLLSLTHYQTNGNKLIFEKINLNEVIEDATKKIAPLAKSKDIKINLKTNIITLKADKQNLEKLLLILLDNAVKYTPKQGKVSVTTSSDKKQVVIKVKDTGIGIAPKDIPYIFNRFYRADTSRSKLDVAGFGLGLSLAKKIAELHHGNIEVSSTPDKGSTFVVKLPL